MVNHRARKYAHTHGPTSGVDLIATCQWASMIGLAHDASSMDSFWWSLKNELIYSVLRLVQKRLATMMAPNSTWDSTVYLDCVGIKILSHYSILSPPLECGSGLADFHRSNWSCRCGVLPSLVPAGGRSLLRSTVRHVPATISAAVPSLTIDCCIPSRVTRQSLMLQSLSFRACPTEGYRSRK